MASMNISLPDKMRDFVQERINEGRYASTSDYVRDLIRKDQERHARIATLQAAITEGTDSGVAEDFSMEAIQADLDAEA